MFAHMFFFPLFQWLIEMEDKALEEDRATKAREPGFVNDSIEAHSLTSYSTGWHQDQKVTPPPIF